jgi:hypothetical protein
MTTPKRLHRRKPPPPGQPVAMTDTTPVNPNFFYRKYEGPKYFGLAPSALDDAIKAGLIPAPYSPTGGRGSRALGWHGDVILEHQRKRKEAASKAAKPARKAGAS